MLHLGFSLLDFSSHLQSHDPEAVTGTVLGAGNIAVDKPDPGLAFIKFIVEYFNSEPALALVLNQVSLG